jgi:hypothetical protein
MNEAFTDDDLANAEDRMRQAEAARTADRPSLRDAAQATVAHGKGLHRYGPLHCTFEDHIAALRQALEGENHREARQRHVPGAIDIFDLVCSCGWRQSKQADPDEDWWVHVTSEREFAFRPSTGSEEGR